MLENATTEDGSIMSKETWKPGNMLYPVPAVMVSCADAAGNDNIITVAWAGTVCTNPAMLSISVRPERHSYGMICETGEFVVNLVGADLARACDWCGVKSGRDVDKWAECSLTPEPAETLEHAPAIAEAPVSIECKVRQILKLGSHHMFLAEVSAVRVDDDLIDEDGKLRLDRAGLISYSHGEYFQLGRSLGTFGYSVRKKPEGKGRRARNQKVGKHGDGGGHAGGKRDHGAKSTPGKRTAAGSGAKAKRTALSKRPAKGKPSPAREKRSGARRKTGG